MHFMLPCFQLKRENCKRKIEKGKVKEKKQLCARGFVCSFCYNTVMCSLYVFTFNILGIHFLDI